MGESPARVIEEAAREMRGALAGLRAAAETLEKYPGLEAGSRARLMGVVAEEAGRLGELIRRLEAIGFPAKEPETAIAGSTSMSVAEFARGLEEAALAVGLEVAAEGAEGGALAATRLDLSGPQALAATSSFLARLRGEMAVSRGKLRFERVEQHLLIDLSWRPEPDQVGQLLDWQIEALSPASDEGASRGLRTLARDHGGEAWLVFDRSGAAAHVKVMLPLVADEAR